MRPEILTRHIPLRPKLLTHDIPLRPNLVIRFTLPTDLTLAEAVRLGGIIAALAFAGEEETADGG